MVWLLCKTNFYKSLKLCLNKSIIKAMPFLNFGVFKKGKRFKTKNVELTIAMTAIKSLGKDECTAAKTAVHLM